MTLSTFTSAAWMARPSCSSSSIVSAATDVATTATKACAGAALEMMPRPMRAASTVFLGHVSNIYAPPPTTQRPFEVQKSPTPAKGSAPQYGSRCRSPQPSSDSAVGATTAVVIRIPVSSLRASLHIDNQMGDTGEYVTVV